MTLYIVIYTSYRLEKYTVLVDTENKKNDKLKTSNIKFSPEFQKTIDDAKSQIEKLDVNYYI